MSNSRGKGGEIKEMRIGNFTVSEGSLNSTPLQAPAIPPEIKENRAAAEHKLRVKEARAAGRRPGRSSSFK